MLKNTFLKAANKICAKGLDHVQRYSVGTTKGPVESCKTHQVSFNAFLILTASKELLKYIFLKEV